MHRLFGLLAVACSAAMAAFAARDLAEPPADAVEDAAPELRTTVVQSLDLEADVIRLRSDGTNHRFEFFHAQDDSDSARAACLRQALCGAKGCSLWLGGKTFDFGEAGYVPLSHVSIRALAGMPILKNRWAGAAEACAFELGHDVVLDGLTFLDGSPNDGKQNPLLGYAGNAEHGTPAVSRATALVSDCTLIGREWALYLWSGGNANRIVARNCLIASGLNAVNAGRSSGADAQYIDLHRCRLLIQPWRTDYSGAVSEGTFGITVRGGVVRTWDCTIDITGTSRVKRCAGVTDSFDGGAAQARQIHHNLVVRIDRGDFQGEAFDADQRLGAITLFGGSGSGPDGQWRTHGDVQMR